MSEVWKTVLKSNVGKSLAYAKNFKVLSPEPRGMFVEETFFTPGIEPFTGIQ